MPRHAAHVRPARARSLSLLLATVVGVLPALVTVGLTTAPAQAAGASLSYVAATSTAGSRTGHTVTVPSTVRAGDSLVLFLTTASTTASLSTPAGWTLLQSRDGTGTRGRVWTRTATAGDPGKAVVSTSSVAVRSAMALAAYRGSGGASKVTASASSVRNVAATSHTAPSVAVGDSGSWLVNFFSERSATALTWSAPATSVARTSPTGAGTGKISGLLADSGAAVATGTAAGRTARTSVSTTRDVLASVVVSPGPAAPANRAPTASFTSACTALSCAFDASASADPEGATLTYAWAYGDGRSATGATATHAYAAAGSRTVTLTVSDGTLTGSTTRVVTPTAPPVPPQVDQLVPGTPRTGQPKIADGEIWDIEVVGKRVFVAGSFTRIANATATNTTSYAQPGLASYNYDTGLVDAAFRPTFSGAVEAVEASPDGKRLYIGGTFNTVDGVARKKIASLDLTTGAPLTGFTANADSKVTELAVTGTTVYAGGRFTLVNGAAHAGLAAVDGLTGTVDAGFVNNLSAGIGTGGELTVQRLKLTHDETKLLVVHTGRQINGQDRYGVALISTGTKQLLPWRSHLWQDNLQFVGGIQRAYGADIAPDDSYFAVSSGSGGDRPPINDTVVALPVDGGNDVQPLWISRCFDSVYSVAVTDNAVYIGGHFSWNESPSAPDPWPGLDDVGYGTGQGLSGYGLGDAVVRREHLGALDPRDGKALEWSPESNSYEGNKTLEMTPRGLFSGGDATQQGGAAVGRVAFFDFGTAPVANGVDTTITGPIEGRVEPAGIQFDLSGTAEATGGVRSVAVEVLDRASRQYLQDDLTTWGPANTVEAVLASPGAATTSWSLPLTVTGNHTLQATARATSAAGTKAPAKAVRRFETFGLADRPPSTTITSPASGVVKTTTFTVTGTASDDVGVTGVSFVLRDANNQLLQDDGSVGPTYNAIRLEPDVVGALSTTWSREVTVPHEGTWKMQARSVDTAGQPSLDTFDRQWIVSSTGKAPTVSISSPATMVPPTAAQVLTIEPGKPVTFSGSATDDGSVVDVSIALRNLTTRENLSAGGQWSPDSVVNLYRISPPGLSQSSYNWSYTTPFDLKPGSYELYVRATDDMGISTAQSNWAALRMNAQVAGDAPPKALLATSGLVNGGQVLHLDLSGSATDDLGVSAVRVALRELDTSRYLQPDGTLATSYATVGATPAAPGATSTGWTLPVDLPSAGDWAVTAYAVDTAGQQDTSTTGATAEYRIYPGDAAPVFNTDLLAPVEGATFGAGRIFVSGRAEDDQMMAKVEVAVLDGQGRYLTSTGVFTSTTPSWRTAFINSPGSPGSNFSYTTPVLPAGGYTVLTRATDQHDNVTVDPPVRHVTVTIPPGNVTPQASFTASCTQNVCTFDGRGSSDENAPTLTYAWSYGTSASTGPLPTKTFTAAGTYTVRLTVTDEWGASGSTTGTVTITEPTGNLAPTPVLNPPSCAPLVCNFSAVGSADPNTGDTVGYRWDFGDLTAASTSSAPTHTFPAAGTYTVTLTVTDGWGRSAGTTRSVTVTAP